MASKSKYEKYRQGGEKGKELTLREDYGSLLVIYPCKAKKLRGSPE